jgi:hypothetical protein
MLPANRFVESRQRLLHASMGPPGGQSAHAPTRCDIGAGRRAHSGARTHK